jgi:serine/threonine protein kinase
MINDYCYKSRNIFDIDINFKYSSNMLLTKENDIKLCDFAIAFNLEQNEKHKADCLGTLAYMSPELSTCDFEQCYLNSDIW